MKISEIVHMEDTVNETFYLDNGTYQVRLLTSAQ